MREFWSRPRRELGATAVEYGILLAGIAAVIITSVGIFGGAVANLFRITF